jgi:hypothetical protein
MFSSKSPQETSLEDLAYSFSDRSNKSITKQGIQERFNDHAVAFLQSVLADQLSNQLPLIDKKTYSNFNRIRIKDSTRYRLPENLETIYTGHGGGSGPAQISIQYEYDLMAGKALDLSFTGANRNDQQDSKETLHNIEKGDLLIRDLGYTTQGYVKHVQEKGAYYLNRLNPKWILLDQHRKPINFSKVLRKIKKNSRSLLEISVCIRIGKELFPSRLIVSRVDQKTYEKRLHRVNMENKRRGFNVSEAYKVTAALNLFITNVPSEWLATDQVRRTYGLRWQIELIFKTWKSHLQINKVKSVRTQRFQCELMARFIWILLNWQVYRITQRCMNSKCSIWKFFKNAFRTSDRLRQVLFENRPASHWLELIIPNAARKYRTEIKNGKHDYSQILNDLLA